MNFNEDWHEAYAAYVVKYGKRPPAISALDVQVPGPKPASFLELEQDIFLRTFEETVAILGSEPVFQEYSSREQVLAVWYTWLEQWVSFQPVLYFMHRKRSFIPLGDDFMTATRASFQQWMAAVIRRGIKQEEIADRWMISDAYVPVMWYQVELLFRTFFSSQDNDTARTDAMIEKSVNFLMDLFQPNALDSGFDLVRFLIQPLSNDKQS